MRSVAVMLAAAALVPACSLAVSLDGYAGDARDAATTPALDAASDAPPAEASPDAPSCPADRFLHGTSCVPKPVAYWTFDEGMGSTVADSSGNGIAGTIAGAATWVAGHVGAHALSFDGSSNEVTFGDPAKLDFGVQSFTYTVLVFQDAPAGQYDIAWWKGGSSVNEIGYDIELGSDGWGASLSDGNRTAIAGFGSAVKSEWTRLVAVVDRNAGELRTYTNGVLMETKPLAGFGSVSSSRSAYVGSGNASAWFKGVIDDVMIFDSALSPTDITALNP